MTRTSFYLHSTKNRELYPSTKYPLTHLLDYQSLQRHLLKRPKYVKHFKYTFIVLLLIVLISTVFFRIHIYAYNSFFGPFHHNLEEFIEHINTYPNVKSWFWRKEYIQIELGENNIQNPTDTYDTIRRYSDPRIRENHIATYKKVKKPKIYIKLPTRSRKYFHIHLPFRFSSYSIQTLKCIIRKLQSTSEIPYQTWTEKSEYVNYINEEYEKNSTLFNMLVLTKCGILIGYLYKPLYEKAFTPTREYTFYQHDFAFETTRQYYPFFLSVIYVIIFILLFLKGLFYFIIYLSNIIRFQLFYKYGFLSFPLDLFPDVVEELWYLNTDDYLPYQQLLHLDELIQKTEHKLNNQLFIVENHLQQLFVILLKTKLNEQSYFEDELSPFSICPVTDIRKLVQYKGICFGEDSSWIIWPSTIACEQNYSEWLHEELMEMSEHYREIYEHRVQYGRSNITSSRQRRRITSSQIGKQSRLAQLIREEENIQRLKLEREQTEELNLRLYGLSIDRPASTQFIATFRLEHEDNENANDMTSELEDNTCGICQDEFTIEKKYVKWPCSSQIPHIFHYECMLKTLRKKNTCPFCREEVEAAQLPTPQYVLSQFFRNVVS